MQGPVDLEPTRSQRLAGQQRVSAVFRREDGRSLHVRKATKAEASQQVIYDALGVTPDS